jgi:hypothetical protein
VHALVTSTIGVSLLQSLTDHIVVAATPKVVRGSAASGFSSALLAGGGLDAAADLERRDDTTFDIDAAVMVSVDRLRAGARRSTVGASRGAVTGGVSYAVRPSIFVEGHVAAGERSERGWSVGVRAGF